MCCERQFAFVPLEGCFLVHGGSFLKGIEKEHCGAHAMGAIVSSEKQ